MDAKTAQGLRDVTHDFYNRVGSFWNNDPYYYWEGWGRLHDIVARSHSFLDIGCGNGRFANFINRHSDSSHISQAKEPITYLGLDYSETLLQHVNTPSYTQFELWDVYHESIQSKTQKHELSAFDCIVMFGFIHHIPTYSMRKQIILDACSLLNSSGKLIVTTWQFHEIPRLQKRIVLPSSLEYEAVCDKFRINDEELEKGDHILNWVKYVHAHRYSHAFDDNEIQSYIEDSEFEIIDIYYADGKLMRRNKYYIIQRRQFPQFPL